MWIRAFVCLLLTCGLGACASNLSERHHATDTPLAWQDLVSTDPVRSKAFYVEVFDWKASELDPGQYWSLSTASGRAVGGLVRYDGPDRNGQGAIWITTLDVKDLDHCLDAVRAAGGTVKTGPTVLQSGHRVATVADPQGALVQLRQGDAKPHRSAHPVWIWHELVTTDPQEAARWYAETFALSVQPTEDGRRLILRDAGMPIASVSRNPFQNADNQWVPVLAVSDLASVTAQVKQHGGRVLAPSIPVQGGRIALIVDPLEAPLFLQEPVR